MLYIFCSIDTYNNVISAAPFFYRVIINVCPCFLRQRFFVEWRKRPVNDITCTNEISFQIGSHLIYFPCDFYFSVFGVFCLFN